MHFYCWQLLVWKEMDYSKMTDTEKQLLVSEVNLLRELRHKHIVRYYDRIIDRTSSVLYIVMEYCECGDLGSLIVKLRDEGLVLVKSKALFVYVAAVSSHSKAIYRLFHKHIR